VRATAALAALLLLGAQDAAAQGAVAQGAAAQPAAAPGVTVVGLGGQSVQLSPAALADLPRAEAMLHEGAKAAPYQGATLSSILRESGTPVGPRAHGAPMKAFVVVIGADGYKVVLSLAETDPEFRVGPVVLADRAAGAALDARQGPYRLVIGDDLKPWRAVRHVVRIEVRSAP
jgi:hypothetical protein